MSISNSFTSCIIFFNVHFGSVGPSYSYIHWCDEDISSSPYHHSGLCVSCFRFYFATEIRISVTFTKESKVHQHCPHFPLMVNTYVCYIERWFLQRQDVKSDLCGRGKARYPIMHFHSASSSDSGNYKLHSKDVQMRSAEDHKIVAAYCSLEKQHDTNLDWKKWSSCHHGSSCSPSGSVSPCGSRTRAKGSVCRWASLSTGAARCSAEHRGVWCPGCWGWGHRGRMCLGRRHSQWVSCKHWRVTWEASV